MKEPPQKFTFPKNFMWGSATSSHQVEGGNEWNDWAVWEKKGTLKIPSLQACRHYELYEKDFDIAKSLHQNAHRFSLEWSRFQPKKDEWNEEAFQHYRRVLEALKNRGIEPIVTLHHFTIPEWVAEQGGFHNPKIVEHFGEFARRMIEAYGDLVTYWMTINEPMILLFKGYLVGEWPPGLISIRRALKALRVMILAHIRAYDAMHAYADLHPGQVKKPMIGLAQHMGAFTPCRPASALDQISTWIRHYFSNHLILKALRHGFLFFPGVYAEELPERRTFDYIGLNYYTRHFVHFTNLEFPGVMGDDCTLKHHSNAGPRNDMGWEIYPKGIFDLLLELKQYQVPIIISENGICTEDDSVRKEFIHRHIVEVAHAIEKHVPVIGYLHWSLLDNFEWEHGFKPRFGLIEVDYKTHERRVKESAKYYSEIAKTNEISLNL